MPHAEQEARATLDKAVEQVLLQLPVITA